MDRDVMNDILDELYWIEPYEDDIWRFEKFENGNGVRYEVYNKRTGEFGYIERKFGGIFIDYYNLTLIKWFMEENGL